MHKRLSTCVASIALAATMVASVLKAQDTETLVSIWDGVYTPSQMLIRVSVSCAFSATMVAASANDTTQVESVLCTSDVG